MPDPWERMENETCKAFAAFVNYRDYGSDRSIQKAIERLTGGRRRSKVAQAEEWSARYKWVERAAAWDIEKDRIRREAQVKEIEDMAKRHVQMAVMMQAKAVEKLKDLEAKKLSATDVERLISSSTKIERDARGIPEKVEHSGEVGVNVIFQYNPNAIQTVPETTTVPPKQGEGKTITGGN